VHVLISILTCQLWSSVTVYTPKSWGQCDSFYVHALAPVEQSSLIHRFLMH